MLPSPLPSGWEVVDGVPRQIAPSPPSPPPPAGLPDRPTLVQRLYADAERVRLKYLTPGAGMVLTYQEKKAQADSVIAMGQVAANALANHGSAEFPTLSASVPAEAANLYAAAQLVIERYQQFAALSRVIESTRLNGKNAIVAAPSDATAVAAYEAITWSV